MKNESNSGLWNDVEETGRPKENSMIRRRISEKEEDKANEGGKTEQSERNKRK